VIDSTLILFGVTILLLGSPGPATLGIAATSATFGVKQSIPFLIGILLGLTAALAGAVFGIAVLFTTWPETRLTVQIVGALYISFIAFKIATAPILQSTAEAAKNIPGLLDGFILNLLNVKAYAVFFAIFSQFLLPFTDERIGYLMTAAVCFIVATVVDIGWLFLGGVLKSAFEKPTSARRVRFTFATLMVVAVISTFLI